MHLAKEVGSEIEICFAHDRVEVERGQVFDLEDLALLVRGAAETDRHIQRPGDRHPLRVDDGLVFVARGDAVHVVDGLHEALK